MQSLYDIQGKIPQLKKLAIDAEWARYAHANLTAFGTAPALKEVCLRHISPSELKLPWSQVEVFSFQISSPSAKVSIAFAVLFAVPPFNSERHRRNHHRYRTIHGTSTKNSDAPSSSGAQV
ncbi:hypothetical protein HGRIS_006977 [Hohenbuehelia grisea]|uniref:Uncharacterized protein n=1 Tax=Hohenbuehelia grisea TaxID=104357 RepID=A0ABR3JB10_9AGAR